MSEPVLLVLGLAAAVAFAIVAKRFALPYPIVFVLAGTVLAFVPGLPEVRISPDWIFLSILPPLLFSAGWTTDWVLFRSNLRPILLLAIGLVVATTAVVAVVAERIVPGLGLAGALVLGAIVSPPDAIAAVATFERFSVPRRIVAILEGEGLVNDATALVIYAYAVSAVTVGASTLTQIAGSFVYVTIAGIAAGVAVTWIVERLARILRKYELSDSLIENLTIIGAPYAAYLGGQAIHASGVLAVVAAGILVSRRSSVIFGPETRLIATNVWTLWIYVLNAYVFLAIGLQLRTIVRDDPKALALLPAALAISALLIVVRFVWVFSTTWLVRLVPQIRRTDPLPPAAAVTVIAWTGMRGIVSLAAALALPYAARGGAPFPGRNAIVFITFVVIFVTLVGQGLTLIPLLRRLKLEEESDGERRETDVRLAALEAGLARIAEMERAGSDNTEEREVLARLRDEYEHRIDHLRHHGTGAPESDESRFDHEAQTQALHAERRAIMELRDRGQIPDEIFRRVQYDVDLAEARMF
jgi:monovalent cation/hydrogen antiporter